MTQPGDPEIEQCFAEALAQRGPAYRASESRLRGFGARALPELARHESGPDPHARLLARVLRRWIAGEPEFDAALASFADEVAAVRGTPIGAPVPLAVAQHLRRRFADRVAELLALRLCTDRDAPRWQRYAITFYLGVVRPAGVTDALLSAALECDDEVLRADMAKAAKDVGDPDLGAAIARARAQCAARGQVLPPVLEALARS